MYQRLINASILQQTKRQLEMAEITIKAIIFYCIYYPLYLTGLLVINYNDIRYWLLTGFLIITGSWRFFRWLRRDDKNNALKEIEIREREAAVRETELQQMEREDALIRKLIKP